METTMHPSLNKCLLALGLTATALLRAPAAPTFVRGDVNSDGQVSLTDVAQVFESLAFGDPPIPCPDALDVDDDGSIPSNGLVDVYDLWTWLFRQGPQPKPPFPKAGVDPTTNDNFGCDPSAFQPPKPPDPGFAYHLEGPKYIRRGSQSVEAYLRVTTTRAVGAFSFAYKLNKKLLADVQADFAGTVFPKIERSAFESSPFFRFERIALPNDPDFDLLLIAAVFAKSSQPAPKGAGSPYVRIQFAATEGALDDARLLRLAISVKADAPLGTVQTALEPAGTSALVPGDPGFFHGLRNELSPIDLGLLTVSLVPFEIGPWRTIAWDAGEFLRADANGDHCQDLSDPLHTLNYLFLGRPRSLCPDAAASNDDGRLDISDSVYTLSYLFSGGPAPPAPIFIAPGDCWFDMTEDELDECTYTCAECSR